MKPNPGSRIPQIFIIIAILLFIVVAVLSVVGITSLSKALAWEKHTQQVLIQLEETMIGVLNAETGVRGYLIVQDENVLIPYNDARQNIQVHLSKLRDLTTDNQVQAEKVERLEKMIAERLTFLASVVEERKQKNLEDVSYLFTDPRGRELSGKIRSLISEMKDEETRLYGERESNLTDSLSNTRILTYVAGFAGLFFLGIAAVTNFSELKKRRKAEDELRFAYGDLEKRIEERTHELKAKNEELLDQISQRERSEQYHRIALESGNLGAWRFDPKNNKAEIDERGLHFFGFMNGDFDGSGENLFSQLHREDFERVESEFKSAISEKKGFNVEFRVLTSDGATRWANCTGQPQLDENGEISFIIGNCRDITIGKESEIALKRSEQQVRNVIDNLFAFVGVLSPEGVLLEANKTALNSASLRAEDVIGKEFAETYWWSYSKDIQEQLLDSITRASAGESVRYDVIVRLAEDKFIPIDFMIAPLYDESGKITHLIPSGLDLSPRKEAEDALRKSENFANAILDSLSAHIAVVDKKGEIIAVNDAWKTFAVSNCVAEELVHTGIGQNYFQVCRRAEDSAVEEAGVILENLTKILNGEQRVFSLEYPCHSPTEDRWFMLQITAMQGEDGGAVISHINITDRKKAEIELKNSEEFNRSIFESSPDSVMIMEPDGKLHSINTSGLHLMEIEDFAPFVGKNWVDLWENEENELAYQAVQQANKGKTVYFEGFRKTIKGTPKWWDVTVAPVLDSQGKATLLISNSRDITERRQFESALHRANSEMEFVLEVAQLGVWSLDLKNKRATRSARHDQIFGYPKLAPNWTYEIFLDHVLPEFREEVDSKFKKAIDDNTEWDFETKIRRADGDIRWIWARGQMQTGDRDELKMHGTVTDITERKEAEREREELLKNEKAARKDAEIANRLRDEFLATVSHELRAPLNSILGWSRLLERGNLDEITTEKAVTTIIRNAESQNRLIEDLLDVSRIISGKLRLEVMTIKPINIVEAALETVRPAAEAKGITLEIKQDTVISHISGDPNRLQQVIWNLLSNAIKFTPNDGRVTLEIEREDSFVNLRVKDTGVGIKEEFLPHVFDRFRQADASSIRKFGGLGLGLAIVRHITEMHGGTVYVESEGEGKGSTFTVRLPLLVESDNNEETTAQSYVAEKNPQLSLDGLLILVVDDEEDTRQLLVQALTFYGATVISAPSASEAISEIQDKNPDFLVSDIGMPDEDGYSLIRRVRNLPNESQKNLPAVALTAFTRAQDRMRALSAGFQNHVSKPVEPDELVTVIASLTGRLHMEDEN